MQIKKSSWDRYVRLLRKVSDKAAQLMEQAIKKYGLENNKKLVEYAYALVSKYGEASGSITCEMYDAIVQASGLYLPNAEVADLPEYGEVAKAVNGTIKTDNPDIVRDVVGTLVKMVSADTMLKNGLRDGAEWAWIPSGDTCAFCLMLASRGWTRASKDAIKKGHAEHIHAHCDCNYCVRFNENTDVAGYDPDSYLDQYNNASDGNWKDKVNAMRRENYQQNREQILEQRRIADEKRKEREQ